MKCLHSNEGSIPNIFRREINQNSVNCKENIFNPVTSPLSKGSSFMKMIARRRRRFWYFINSNTSLCFVVVRVFCIASSALLSAHTWRMTRGVIFIGNIYSIHDIVLHMQDVWRRSNICSFIAWKSKSLTSIYLN